jgi:hypothetical protein
MIVDQTADIVVELREERVRTYGDLVRLSGLAQWSRHCGCFVLLRLKEAVDLWWAFSEEFESFYWYQMESYVVSCDLVERMD